MRTFFRVLLSNFIFLLLIILAFSFCLEEVVFYTIYDSFFKEAIREQVTSIIRYNDLDIDSALLMKMEQMIENSPEVKETSMKYLDYIVEKIVSGDTDYSIEFGNTIENLIEQNEDKLLEYGIQSEQINQIKEAIRAENEFFITSEFTTNQMLTHLTEEQTKAIQIYDILRSDTFRYGVIGLFFLSSIFIIVLSFRKKTYFQQLGGTFILAGILIEFFTSYGLPFLFEYFLGYNLSIHTSLLKKVGFIYIGIGLLFLFVSILFKNVRKRANKEH